MLRYHLPWLRNTDAWAAAPLTTLGRAVAFTLRDLGGGERVFRTPDGLAFASMPNNFTSFAMYCAGAPDPEMLRFMQHRLRPGGVFVDAGANIGAYSILAARLVGPEGRVASFEAHPITFGFLERSIALNGFSQVQARNLALGAAPGRVRLAFNPANPGETHVADDGGTAAPGAEVAVATLDSALAEAGITRVDYLKIDVEGFELPVLQGAVGTLRDNPDIAVQTELVERHASRYGHSVAAIEALMRGLGFVPHRIGNDGAASPITGRVFGEVAWLRD
jgi:FkbM family methyltransferase